jgi:hypothetical protein
VESAQITPRGCSQPLQRAVTDFGADSPFGQVAHKLKEHYGVDLPVSTIRRITEGHAEVMFKELVLEEYGRTQGGEAVIVAEMDGGMIPIVEPDPTQNDQRKGKSLKWQEAKVCLAHPLGSTALTYGATLEGGVEGAGRHLLHCAVKAGLGPDTQVHAVGDGAPWIANQVDICFGAQGTYLVDFYHACDYLAAAAKVCAPDFAAWLDQQKVKMKAGRSAEVLAALAPYQEPSTTADENAPVRRAYRYFSNRLTQLGYQGALQKGWPIGSGEIESAHRYLVQQRLKRPGAWWLARHAEHLLALRLNRANHQWERYWQDHLPQAA